MPFLCSATYAIYESFTCDQTQGHKFKLEILLASQNKLLPKFQKERNHEEKMKIFLEIKKGEKTKTNTKIV